MKWLIAADTGCNIYTLNSEVCDFKSVPLTIRVGEKEFIDTQSLNKKMMMDEVYSYSGKTGSACPSPEAFREAFDGYNNIILFTITSGLSGSYGSAKIAKDMELEGHPEKNIEVIDTLSAGPEITLLVEYAQKLIAEGLDFSSVVEKVKAYQSNTHLGFILDCLDNLVKNGRVNKLVAATVGVLGIKLVGCASKKGTLEVTHKARNFNIAIKKLIADMEEHGFKGGKVNITHCFNPDGANTIKNEIIKKFQSLTDKDILISPTNGLCSYYAEKGGILVGYTSI